MLCLTGSVVIIMILRGLVLCANEKREHNFYTDFTMTFLL